MSPKPDNTVTLAFAPAPPSPEAIHVIVDNLPGVPGKAAGFVGGGKAAAGSKTGVSARTSDILTNAVNSALSSSQLNRLGLPSQ